MKKNIILTTLLTGILLMGLKAKSQVMPVDNSVDKDKFYSYVCTNAESDKVTVNKIYSDGEVLATKVELTTLHFNKKFEAVLVESMPSFLYNVQLYDLFLNEVKAGQLKIVSHKFIGRGGCGRAGCAHHLDQEQAELKIGSYETSFDCQ